MKKKVDEKEKARNRLYIGNLAELKFQYIAHKLNFICSKPLHNNENYDFIIDFNGKLNKVQIKATTFFDNNCKSGRYIVKTSRGNFYNSSLYTKKFVDYIIIYIDTCDVWYIIPVEKIKTNSIRVYPHIPGSSGIYEKYLNNWESLK